MPEYVYWTQCQATTESLDRCSRRARLFKGYGREWWPPESKFERLCWQHYHRAVRLVKEQAELLGWSDLGGPN